MTALLITFTCIIILFNLGPILNKLFEPKNYVKRYKVQLLEDDNNSDQAVEIDGKKYKLIEI